MHFSTKIILLKDKITKLESALINLRKRPNKKKPLLQSLSLENNGRVLFLSLLKVQQVWDVISQKNKEAAQEQAHKNDKKLQ